jgi:hypothetical protein
MAHNASQQTEAQRQRKHYEDHIFNSYFILRIGLAILAIALPIILWGGGAIWDIPFQPTMSDYYNATADDGKTMRDWFVGILWAIGIFMILYRGRDSKENWILNVAGVLSVLVAMCPTDSGEQDFTFHGLFAVSLFICMAISVWAAKDSLMKLENAMCGSFFMKLYRVLAVLMALAPIIAWLLASGVGRLYNYTFIAEALGVGVFAIYWLAKTWEISISRIEDKCDIQLSPASQIRTETPIAFEEGGWKEVEVNPREPHSATGIIVKAGSVYEFKAEGKWRDWLITCDANGWPKVLHPVDRLLTKLWPNIWRLPKEPPFLLCGSIGKDDSSNFPIGSGPTQIPASKDGELFLFANDWYCAYGNNNPLPVGKGGPMRVTIKPVEFSVDRISEV